MKKFYLFCDAGMSTSLIASKMQKVANDHNLPIEVKAFAYLKIANIIDEYNPDMILLGPQVRHLYDKTVQQYGHLNKPIMVIDADDYGKMDGERVLKMALKTYKERSAGGNN